MEGRWHGEDRGSDAPNPDAGGGREASPQGSMGGVALLVPQFQTSGLQKWEQMNFIQLFILVPGIEPRGTLVLSHVPSPFCFYSEMGSP